MVGPPTAADRDQNRRLVAAGLVGVVTLSAGMSGVYGGASLFEIGLLAAAGCATGVALVVVIGAWP